MATMRDITPMRLEELERAPLQIRGGGHVAATPDAIFEELRDPSLWFPMMRRSVWHTGATSGVGAMRDVEVAVLGTFREHMLAWDRGERVAFTMTATSSPFVDQMGEDWRISPDGDGARVSYLVAGRFTGKGRLIRLPLELATASSFARGFRRIAKRAGWSINVQRGRQPA